MIDDPKESKKILRQLDDDGGDTSDWQDQQTLYWGPEGTSTTIFHI